MTINYYYSINKTLAFYQLTAKLAIINSISALEKTFIEFIRNKSDFTIEIINEADDWIIFKCSAKINKPRCGTGRTGGGRMTLNKLAEIVLNLSNTVETGFAEIRQDIKIIKEDVADIKVRVTNLEQDVADIKRCPTIQKELSKLTK